MTFQLTKIMLTETEPRDPQMHVCIYAWLKLNTQAVPKIPRSLIFMALDLPSLIFMDYINSK